MQTRLGRVVLLVDDYDKAFEFYKTNFFCKLLYDAKAVNGLRYLHIAFSEDDNTGIWLLQADQPEQEGALGRQTAGQPTLVIYTDDARKMHEHVRTNAVEMVGGLVMAADSKFFQCLDLYGNMLTVVELN
jgi:predicted enzyme related to lactoylglutathione lyase